MSKEAMKLEPCGGCYGSGWITRDPDIGTDQECFVCGGSGACPKEPEQEPVAWLELLREARDNCKASIVEEGISASRKEYRIDLEARLTAALNSSPPAQRKPLTDEQMRKVLRTCQSDAVELLRNRWLYVKEFGRALEAAHGIKENT